MVVMKADARQEHSSPTTTRVLPLKIDSRYHCHQYSGCDADSLPCYAFNPNTETCYLKATYERCVSTTKTVCGQPPIPMKIDGRWLHDHSVDIPGVTVSCFDSRCDIQLSYTLVSHTTSDQVYE